MELFILRKYVIVVIKHEVTKRSEINKCFKVITGMVYTNLNLEEIIEIFQAWVLKKNETNISSYSVPQQ